MIMRLFKKYLLPSEENSHNPHLFRDASISVLFLIVVVTFAVTVSGRILLSGSDLVALVLPKVLVDYTNDERLAQKYSSLNINPVLEQAAQLKANDMALKGYFAHKSPEGLTPWHWFEEVGYEFSHAGENLAVNFVDSVDVSRAWMQSPGHRANILNKDFTEIGIATAEGLYQGRKTTFVVQLFGTPAKNSTSDLSVATTTSLILEREVVSSNVASTTPEVLSESVTAEVLSENEINESFIYVEKESTSTTPTNDKYSTAVDRALLSPGRVLNYVYMSVIVLIMLGALLALISEVRRHEIRKALLLGGLLLIISGLLYIYRTMLFYPTVIG